MGDTVASSGGNRASRGKAQGRDANRRRHAPRVRDRRFRLPDRPAGRRDRRLDRGCGGHARRLQRHGHAAHHARRRHQPRRAGDRRGHRARHLAARRDRVGRPRRAARPRAARRRPGRTSTRPSASTACASAPTPQRPAARPSAAWSATTRPACAPPCTAARRIASTACGCCSPTAPTPGSASRTTRRSTARSRPPAPSTTPLTVEIEARWPRILRCVDGYNLPALAGDKPHLARFLCGSEGTLAVVLEIEVMLDPVPDLRAWTIVRLDSLDAIGDANLAVLPSDAVGRRDRRRRRHRRQSGRARHLRRRRRRAADRALRHRRGGGGGTRHARGRDHPRRGRHRVRRRSGGERARRPVPPRPAGHHQPLRARRPPARPPSSRTARCRSSAWGRTWPGCGRRSATRAPSPSSTATPPSAASTCGRCSTWPTRGPRALPPARRARRRPARRERRVAVGRARRRDPARRAAAAPVRRAAHRRLPRDQEGLRPGRDPQPGTDHRRAAAGREPPHAAARALAARARGGRLYRHRLLPRAPHRHHVPALPRHARRAARPSAAGPTCSARRCRARSRSTTRGSARR